MSWSNVPTKNPGDPVTAENWNGLVGNPAALADGEPGAPKVRIPEAVRTDEMDTAKVLRPNGSGGVTWAGLPAHQILTASGSSQNANIPGLSQGTWLAWGDATQTFDESPPLHIHDHAVITDGQIVHSLAGAFSIQAGVLRLWANHNNTVATFAVMRVS